MNKINDALPQRMINFYDPEVADLPFWIEHFGLGVFVCRQSIQGIIPNFVLHSIKNINNAFQCLCLFFYLFQKFLNSKFLNFQIQTLLLSKVYKHLHLDLPIKEAWGLIQLGSVAILLTLRMSVGLNWYAQLVKSIC